MSDGFTKFFLKKFHVEADRLQVSGERKCERQSDVAQAGDADGFVVQFMIHSKTPVIHP